MQKNSNLKLILYWIIFYIALGILDVLFFRRNFSKALFDFIVGIPFWIIFLIIVYYFSVKKNKRRLLEIIGFDKNMNFTNKGQKSKVLLYISLFSFIMILFCWGILMFLDIKEGIVFEVLMIISSIAFFIIIITLPIGIYLKFKSLKK